MQCDAHTKAPFSLLNTGVALDVLQAPVAHEVSSTCFRRHDGSPCVASRAQVQTQSSLASCQLAPHLRSCQRRCFANVSLSTTTGQLRRVSARGGEREHKCAETHHCSQYDGALEERQGEYATSSSIYGLPRYPLRKKHISENVAEIEHECFPDTMQEIESER